MNSYSYKAGQLLPENFEEAVKKAGLDKTVTVNHRDGMSLTVHSYVGGSANVFYGKLPTGYDHSYFFIQTFGPDHIAFHSKFLKA